MIDLQLRVELDDGAVQDVAAELSDQHRIVELAQALARHVELHLPAGHDPKLVSLRTGAELPPQETVVDSDLLAGDRVQLRLASIAHAGEDQTEVAGLYCDVVSGPSSGTSVLLGPGRVTIGRAPTCDLTLEDPTVSKEHATLIIDSAGNVEVEPVEGVTNPVMLDGRPLEGLSALPLESVLQLGSCALVVRRYELEPGATRDQLGQIPFNRTPYRHPDLSPVEVRGPGRAPAPYEPRPLMVLAMLAPVLGGVAFALILGRALFLIFALLSPLSMLGMWLSERRRGGASHQQQVETFERRLTAWEQRYDGALEAERTRRYQAAPDVADLARRAELRTPELWARNRHSNGFLELRLGLGDAPASAHTPLPPGVDEDPDQRVEQAIERRRLLPSVPIIVDLPQRGVLAIHGDPREVETSVSSLVLQAATLHSPDDLVICGALHPRRTFNDWLKWLPHTRSVVSPVAGDHLGVGTEAADDLLHRVLEAIADRDEDAWPRILLLLDEVVEPDSQLVSAVLEAGPARGVYGLWVGHRRQLVPRQARAVLNAPALRSGEPALMWTTEPTEEPVELSPDRLSLEAAPRLARALAPVRDASSASAAASIPRTAPLLETLGAQTLAGEDVVRRWQQDHGPGLPATIGTGATGPFTIDLVEHGPHALIAGTSGAGKSELLQSAIAALVATHPPTRVNLLFIDYKGGASSSRFQPVPHTVGYVTNLSGELALRALVSLRAELDRRMALMEKRAQDLQEFRERFPEEAPPSLVIVVDEFATLVKEIPDFVAGMVDIAQRGRSLGIHLILATQRPAGAVNDNILANTNLRISLRVLDPADSSSILGSAEAAAIPGPLRGRGFARLGAGGLVEFQSAYAGATYTAATGVTPVVVEGFPTDGTLTVHPEPPPKEAPPAVASSAAGGEADDQPPRDPTHLDVVLQAVVEATDRLGHQRGRRPWLEDLTTFIPLADVLDGRFGPVPERSPGRDVLLGVVDLPAEQAQRPEVLDLEAEGGLLIFGTGGSGRTTTLRTVLASAVADAGPAEVEAFVLDFSGRVLEPLRDLPHVAAVATSDDLEQATRILMHLRTEVSHRQSLLSAARAENLTAYQAMGTGQPLPRLLLLLDGYEVFTSTFERGDLYQWSELLQETVLAGRAVGIHLIATVDRRNSVPAALANAVSGRLILRTADTDALVSLGVSSAVAQSAQLGDGRSMLPGGTVLQVAVVGDEVGNAAQTAALEDLARPHHGRDDARLPSLPDEVTVDALAVPDGLGPRSFALGLADLTAETVVCDLRLHDLVVIGPEESGRSTALDTAARGLLAAGADVWVLCDPLSPLAGGDWEHLAARRDGHRELVDRLSIAARTSGTQPVLIVDGVEQVADDAGMSLEPLLRDGLVRVVASTDAGTLTGYVAGWLQVLKASRRRVLLQPDLLDLPALTSQRIRTRPQQSFPPGRGIVVAGREWQLVQVARVDGAMPPTEPPLVAERARSVAQA